MIKVFEFFLIISSAILMGISQHPLGLGFLSLFSLVPLFGIIQNLISYRDAIRVGVLWGIIFNLISVYWIAFNIGTSPIIAFTTMVLSILILTSGPVLIFTFWCMLNRRGVNIILLSFIWATVELLRSYGTLGFPWVSISNSLINYNLIIQNAEYVGIYGLSFWIVLVNIYIFRALYVRTRLQVMLCIVVIILPLCTGSVILDLNSKINDNR